MSETLKLYHDYINLFVTAAVYLISYLKCFYHFFQQNKFRTKTYITDYY